ncbi:MAG: helix-turn-helix domain-containing protein [Spirosomaceae bacterium]|nr:helix-turn-helix domain-containing protein [Spirosomataceae bacterium]
MMKSYLSENLKTLRKYNKISLEELANAINVSKSAISDYENDKFSPSIAICRKIADFFRITIDDLEYSEILEKLEGNSYKIKTKEALPKKLFEANERIEVLERIRDDLALELKLYRQKIESLQIQLRLQSQLQDSKLSEIQLLKTQIHLLEEKIKVVSRQI